MYDYETARRAYYTDPVFKRLVDSMIHAIDTLQLSPVDLRSAAMFASIVHAQRHPPTLEEEDKKKAG